MNVAKFLHALSPVIKWLLVWFLCGLLLLITFHFTLSQAQPQETLRAGAVLQSSRGSIELQDLDFFSEPGDLKSYEELALFLSRQDEVLDIIQASEVTLLQDGQKQTLKINKRSLADLPLEFWIQVVVAVGGILISGWLWALKNRDLGPIFFFMSGLSMGVSALSSAVYTTRSLALPSEMHLMAQALNSMGATGFGIFMVALFTVYPTRFKHWQLTVASVSVVFVLWTFLVLFQVIPRFLGLHVIILLLMILIIVAIGVQFVRTKGNPTSRAALTWLGLSVLAGAGGWVMANTLPLLWGAKPLDQSYAFITFLIIYIGLAAGLSQYRLFDVGQWAYKFLFYAGGAIVIVLLDAVSIYFGMARAPALGLSLMLVGFLYLPLRDLLWRKFNFARPLSSHELLDHALHVAFATPAQRSERWTDLLHKIFEPLELKHSEENIKEVKISSDGVTLFLPAVAGSPSLSLHYPYDGRSLFNGQFKATAKSLVSLIEEAESNREAYDRGVQEERLRMAQDLHDNVGARLLTGLHAAPGEDVRETIRDAIADIRTLVKGISGENLVFVEALAELRIETQRRLARLDIDLMWPIEGYSKSELVIDYPFYKAIEACIKELVSNIIKHSKASRVVILVNMDSQQLTLSVQDNGVGLQNRDNKGFGLKSLSNRVRQFNGSIVLADNKGEGMLVQITMPLFKRSGDV